jgi:hypothetical protein
MLTDRVERSVPLILVHGITRNQIREHVLHAGVVGELVETSREQAAARFGVDIGVHARGEVARRGN